MLPVRDLVAPALPPVPTAAATRGAGRLRAGFPCAKVVGLAAVVPSASGRFGLLLLVPLPALAGVRRFGTYTLAAR